LPSERGSGLPALWARGRRAHLVLLVATGLGQAVAAGVGAHIVVLMLRSGSPSHRWLLLSMLVASALTVGTLRMAERIVSEVLSQNYVHEIRLGLIRRNLSEGRVNNLGVAVARTTNDLSSVQSWISQGVAPLAVGIPLILGVTVVLLLIDPILAVSLVPPLLILLVGLRLLTPIAYERTRALRRSRGRLAGQIADTILSTTAIRSGGGATRELNRVERHSAKLVGAAIHRAKAAGALRGLAAATSGLMTASTVGTALALGMSASRVVATLTVTGFLASPIHDLGRAAEFRQTYRAARRIIGPAIQPAASVVPLVGSLEAVEEPSVSEASATAPVLITSPDVEAGRVTAEGVSCPDGSTMASLVAQPGDRVLVRTAGPDCDSAVLEQFAGLRDIDAGRIMIGSTDLGFASRGRMRRLVGYGARGMMLARTSIGRAVGYRSSETHNDAVAELLSEVGLEERVGALPEGEGTILRHGGEPLTIPERARVTLARALFNQPPLLVFDHLDADLGRAGRKRMRALLLAYPGVVIAASDTPDEIFDVSIVWSSEADSETAAKSPPPASAPDGPVPSRFLSDSLS